jgi:hypothetical protein
VILGEDGGSPWTVVPGEGEKADDNDDDEGRGE